MSNRGRYRGNRHRGDHTLSSIARETAASLPADSPVLAIFRQAALKLNERHDRHERLVKLSRDITIESKRIIFLLHSAVTKESTEKTVKEANERIQKLVIGPIQNIGLELENVPAYLHSRAVTAGFQEFIEARTLLSLIEKREIIRWTEIQKECSFTIKDNDEERQLVTMVTRNDYMLGLADLSGELMRRTINSISSGDSEECFRSCQVVRDLYTGFISLFGMGKEIGRKLSTTRANVHKVEMAVYALRVRGGEAPPTLVLPSAAPAEWEPSANFNEEEDEGIF